MKKLIPVIFSLIINLSFGQINYVKQYNGITITPSSVVTAISTITPTTIQTNNTLVDADPLRNRLSYIFEHIDKSQVPTGFLEEYGAPLVPLNPFNGLATDSNRVDLHAWRYAYATLYTSRINGTNPLIPLDQVNNLIENAEHSSSNSINNFIGVTPSNNVIPMVLLDVDYNYFRPDAINQNLVQVTNDQLYDVPGRSQSPYYSRKAFLATPTRNVASGAFSVVFKPELYFSSSSKVIQSIAVDFSDGAGFVNASWNTPLWISYTTAGPKQLIVKVTYTDNSTVQCRTDVEVTEANQAQQRYTTPLVMPTHPFPANGTHDGGVATIRYSIHNSSNKILKPLIVVEGYDPSDKFPLLASSYDITDFVRDINNTDFGGGTNFNYALDDLGSYDLIFLNYNNGTDDIRRNATLLKEVINWVNTENLTNNSNVVMGISMGGLVARYALADMTKQGINTRTRLLITHDSPHRGANTPLGFQFLTRQIYSMLIVQGLIFFNATPAVKQAFELLNEPATRQLLIVRANDPDGGVTFNSFLDNEYRSMITFSSAGYQPGYRMIATSLGSECGNQILNPGAELLNINASYFIEPVPWIKKNSLNTEVIVNALPNYGPSQRVSKLRVWTNFKILSVISVNINLVNKSAGSPSNIPPWDGVPGGTQNVKEQASSRLETKGIRVLPIFTLGVNATYAGDFCFVPTVSALDITDLTSQSLSAKYVGGVSPGNNSRFSNFIAQGYNPTTTTYNEPHPKFPSRTAQWLYNEMESVPNNNINCSQSCQIPATSITGNFASSGCGGEQTTFSVTSYGGTATYSWNVSSNLQVLSGQGTTSAVIKQTAAGQGLISCYVTTSCGTTYLNKQVSSGGTVAPQSIDIISDCPEFKFSTQFLQNSYNWSYFKWPSGPVSNYPNYSATIKFVFYQSGTYRVGVTANGNCGVSPITFVDVTVSCGGSAIHVVTSPNPASDQLDVSVVDASESETNTDLTQTKSMTSAAQEKRIPQELDVKLFNADQEVVYAVRTNESVITIPVKELKEGIYYLNVLKGKELTQKQILIKR